MSDSEEWGPWIEHDGRGCPCVGLTVMAELKNGIIEGPFIAGKDAIESLGSPNVIGSAWVHKKHPHYNNNWIIRYRIRKPRALRQLIEMVENLPAPSHAPGNVEHDT